MIGAAIRPYLAVGAVALLLASHAGVYLKGRADSAAVAETRAMQSTIKQLQERGLINEAVRDTSDCDLARELNPSVVCDRPGD